MGVWEGEGGGARGRRRGEGGEGGGEEGEGGGRGRGGGGEEKGEGRVTEKAEGDYIVHGLLMRLSDVLVIQRHLVNEITIRKKQNVGCHGTSYISRRALVRSNSIPNVGRVDYKGVTIFKEDGRSLFDLATSEHPAVMHGGVSTICDTGEVNDRGLPSQWYIGSRGVNVGPSTRYGDGCMSGWG